jgi:hypothetical protein
VSEIIFQDAPESTEAVAPVDFLSLGVSAAAVGNGDLVNGQALPGDLGSNLRFEAETVFLESDTLDHFALECFEAALHVGEVQIRKHVAEQRQKRQK